MKPDDSRLTHNGRIPEVCGRCEKEDSPPTHFIVFSTGLSSIARFFCYKCYKVVGLEIATLNSPNRRN